MSARAWYMRRRRRITYLEHVDWWSADVLLNGPPRPATRAELARQRRLATIARRVARRRTTDPSSASARREALRSDLAMFKYAADIAAVAVRRHRVALEAYGRAAQRAACAGTQIAEVLGRSLEETPPL